MLEKQVETLHIIPNGVQKEYVRDLYRYRELLYFFAWRDILVRYKEAFFGIAWALMRPLLNMVLFAFLFGKIAHLPSDNVDYSLFVLAGMLPWQLFATATVDTCNSVIGYANLITKVYFPRMVIPLSQIIVHLVDFLVGIVLLIGLVIFVQGGLPLSFLALPFFILLSVVLCAGTGLWLAACTVQYRDFRIIVPFFIQFGMFLSPVGYGSFVIPEQWHWLYFLNPMVGIIDGFRWVFFGSMTPYLVTSVTYSVVIAIFLAISGFYYFRNTERTFVDRI